MGENPSPLGEDFLLFVSMTPYLSVSDLVKRVKEKTSKKLLSENLKLSKQFRVRHPWAHGYFAASFGNVTDEVIMEYIDIQDIAERTGDDDLIISP
jgi:putative transposase